MRAEGAQGCIANALILALEHFFENVGRNNAVNGSAFRTHSAVLLIGKKVCPFGRYDYRVENVSMGEKISLPGCVNVRTRATSSAAAPSHGARSFPTVVPNRKWPGLSSLAGN